MTLRNSLNLVGLGVGAAFGFLIQAAGFGDADFIHRMLLFQNAYPYEVFASAVVVGMVSFWILERRRWITPLGGPLKPSRAPIRRRHIYGGLLFGAGWALSTTCPVPAVAMVMSGGILGIAVVAGLFAGVLLGDRTAKQRAVRSFPQVPSLSPAPGSS